MGISSIINLYIDYLILKFILTLKKVVSYAGQNFYNNKSNVKQFKLYENF